MQLHEEAVACEDALDLLLDLWVLDVLCVAEAVLAQLLLGELGHVFDFVEVLDCVVSAQHWLDNVVEP